MPPPSSLACVAMLITCPSCASEYEIAAMRIGIAGRKVRCAACRNSWFVDAPTAGPDSPPPPDPAPAEIQPAFPLAILPPTPVTETAADTVATPMIEPDRIRRPPINLAKARRKPIPRRRHSDPPRQPGRRWMRAATVAATLVLLATPMTVLGRARIVAVLPGTAALFAAAGLPVNVVGLAFEDVASTLGPGPELAVEGRIVNPGREARPVPPLRLVVEDETGQPLYTWPVRAEEPSVGPAGRIGFSARLASPPPAGKRVRVVFDTSAASSQEVASR